jgi:hypothetical protein
MGVSMQVLEGQSVLAVNDGILTPEGRGGVGESTRNREGVKVNYDSQYRSYKVCR